MCYTPVNPGHTLLYDALDLLEHVGVLLVDPVGQVPSVVQDLTSGVRNKRINGAVLFKLGLEFKC
jgi:hypothetical protein